MEFLKFIFTGDLMLGGDFLKKKVNKGNFNKSLFEQLKEANYIISNFENNIGKTDDLRQDKDSHFYCSLRTIDSYIDLFPSSIFCLGNNHINDFGKNGFINSINYLNSYGIKHLGAGFIQDAKRPLIIQNKFIFLNFSTHKKWVNSIIASEKNIGIMEYNLNKIEKIIKSINLKNKFLIVLLHWGYEYIILPSFKQRIIAHKLIDLGVDLIIGTHPHIIQPFEKYKDKYIFYSLGNYFFPNFYYTKSGFYKEWSDNNNRSIMVKLELNEDLVPKVKFFGLKFNTKTFFLDYDKNTEDIFFKVSKRFKSLYENKNYKDFFKKYLNYHYPPYINESKKSIVNYIINRFRKNKYTYWERTKRALLIKNLKGTIHKVKKVIK